MQIENYISPFIPLTSQPKTVTDQEKKDFFDVVEKAKKTDHQVYTQKKINRFGFAVTSNSPGIGSVISSPIAIAKILYNWGKSRYNHLTFDRAEAIAMIASHLSAFVYSVGKILELSYVATKNAVGKALVTFAGFVFFPIEVIYHSVFLTRNNAFTHYLEHDLINFTYDFPARNNRTKERLVKDLEKLHDRVTSLEKRIKKTVGYYAYERLNKDIENLMAKAPGITALRVKELEDETTICLAEYTSKYVKATFEKVDQSYLNLSDKQIKKVDTYGKEALKREDYPTALEKTLSKVQDYHLDNKVALSRILRPWIVEDYTRNRQTILQEIKSTSFEERVEGATKGLEILTKMEKTAQLKKALHITSIAVNSLLLILLITSFTANPLLSPVIIGALALGWFLMDTSVSYGYLDSKDGSFQYKNLIPDWIKWGAKGVSYLAQKAKEAGSYIHNKIMSHSTDFLKDRQIVNLDTHI